MEREQRTSPERLREAPRPVFDLEQMEPEVVVSLATILGEAADVELKSREERLRDSAMLCSLLDRDVGNLPERNLEKAKTLYFALATQDGAGGQGIVASRMGELLRHLPIDDYVTRQQAIDLWLKLLDSDDTVVRAVSERAISDAVDSEWVDEPTARYLDSKLSPEWQREEWWTQN
jgi:hypothetical protein